MLSEQKARKLAQKALRFEIGTMPRLDEIQYSGEREEYFARICISYPRTGGEELTFDKSEAIGEMVVDANTEEVWHTPTEIISDRIEKIKNRKECERRTRDN